MARQEIKSRTQFFQVLAATIQEMKNFIKNEPGNTTWEALDVQLDAMLRWTANDRTPTADERHRITIGTVAVRELEPAYDPVIYDLTQRLHELNYYFSEWP
jgi:hypothetical protein